MKKLIGLLLLFPVACTYNTTHTTTDKELLEEIALLHKKIDSLSLPAQPQKTDTIILRDTLKLTPKKEKKQLAPPPKKPEPKKPIISQPANDTVFHYYINKKISVKLHPWIDGERIVQLFDLYGNKTFEVTEIRKSYSQSYRLRFHPNGAVSHINASFNPGASMYMYYADMTFSTTNEPLVKHKRRVPPYELNESMEKQRPYFWDKKRFEWVQQKVVEETVSPTTSP